MVPSNSRFARLAAVFVVATASVACFSSQTVVKLHPDGAGTIEQVNLVNTAMIGMAAGMMGGDSAKGGSTPKVDEMFNEEQLKQQAAQLGAGVRFVSSERITQNGMQGARAVYAFDNVATLTMGSIGGKSREASADTAPQMQFALTKSGPDLSRLTISFPDPKGAATSHPTPGAESAETQPIPPEALAMVRSMFAGARIGVDIEVDGRIVKTNAPASNGARATLVEVDFGELLSDPARFQALQSLKPGTDFGTVRKALEGAKGVKFPLTPTVTIDFAK
jgi:hypothetical protein